MPTWDDIREAVGPWSDLIFWALLLLFLAGLLKKLWPAFKVIIALVDVMPSLLKLDQFMKTTAFTLAEQDQKIEEIHHETHKNDGSSIKDAIDRVEVKVDTIGKDIEGLKDEDARLQEQFDEHTQPHHPKEGTEE